MGDIILNRRIFPFYRLFPFRIPSFPLVCPLFFLSIRSSLLSSLPPLCFLSFSLFFSLPLPPPLSSFSLFISTFFSTFYYFFFLFSFPLLLLVMALSLADVEVR